MSNSNPEVKVQALLRQHRFRLVRQNKHLVYQNPEGRVYVESSLRICRLPMPTAARDPIAHAPLKKGSVQVAKRIAKTPKSTSKKKRSKTGTAVAGIGRPDVKPASRESAKEKQMQTTNDLGKYAVELQQKIDQLDGIGKCAVLSFIQSGERVRERMSSLALETSSPFQYLDAVRVEIIYGEENVTMNGFHHHVPVASVKRAKGHEINHAASIAPLLEAMAKDIREREYAHNGRCNGDPFERIPVGTSVQDVAEGYGT